MSEQPEATTPSGDSPANPNASPPPGQPLGRAIVAARNFLWDVHAQVAVLLESLDRLMSDEGWTPSNANVTSDIGPALNSDRWLVSYLYRFYFPDDAEHDRMVGVVIHLDPPDGYDEPVCLAFAARFPGAQTHDAIWRTWWDTEPTFCALRGAATVGPVVPEAYQEFLPSAAVVSGIVIPLVSLACEGDLRCRVVEPLLAAVAALEAVG